MVTAPAAFASAGVVYGGASFDPAFNRKKWVRNQPPGREANDWHQHVDKRLHDRAERRADDDADGQIDDIAAHEERFEVFEHERLREEESRTDLGPRTYSGVGIRDGLRISDGYR